ncbi:hypothetical protein V1282_002931 [Nitrobacteraceae bacterium AZCC 2146]
MQCAVTSSLRGACDEAIQFSVDWLDCFAELASGRRFAPTPFCFAPTHWLATTARSPFDYDFTMSATYSAIASDDVSPGDSMPNRLTSPRTPCACGPWIMKSCTATAGGTIFGRIPE